MGFFFVLLGLMGAGAAAGGASGGGSGGGGSNSSSRTPDVVPGLPEEDEQDQLTAEPVIVDEDDDDDDDDGQAPVDEPVSDNGSNDQQDTPGDDPADDQDDDEDDEDDDGQAPVNDPVSSDQDTDDDIDDSASEDDANDPVSDNGSNDHHGHGDHHMPTVAPPGADADQSEIDAYVSAVKAQADTHVHGDDSSKMSEHMAAMDLVPRDEATHVAISDGDWFDPATWYNGEIPGDDAKVLIPEGIHVQYGDVSEARLFTVRVDGELDFATDADSLMVLDTMVVSPTGCLVIGSVVDPVAPDVSVDIVIANNGPIDLDWDPMLLSRGIISHGETSIYGAEIDAHDKVIDDPMTGDTSIRFAEIPEGWAVGDTIVIAGTSYDGYKWDPAIGAKRLYESEDEVRIISAIDGDRIYFDDPLEHDHDTPRDDLKTSVANYSRNVTIQTEDPEDAEVYERGHVMFMHSDDVDVRYAAFVELGRTDKSEISMGAGDFETLTPESNVQGRYSLHLHRTGVENPEDPAIVVGNAVWGSPGWGYVHHDSNALLENNASYDTFGAGYVAETGNETGAWTDNIAIGAEGISWDIIKITSEFDAELFDTAKGGHGFWFQGRLVDASDNVAASVNTGFVYFHRNGDDRMLDFDASLFRYPGAVDYADDVLPEDVPILLFSGNEAFAAKEGLHVVKANPDQGHDVWSHLDDFTAWEVRSGATLDYTSHYLLTDFDVTGKESTAFSDPKVGINIGSNTTEVVIKDAQVDNFETGIDLTKMFIGSSKGTIEDHNYFVIDADITNVDQEYTDYDPRYDTILSSDDLTERTPELQFDGPLMYNEGREYFMFGNVQLNGTKIDSLGETPFPGGTDSFIIERPEVIGILADKGYWTTDDGQAYFLHDIHMTDRLTGEIYYETHPVYIDPDVVPYLGRPGLDYRDAVHNGEQNITQVGGQNYAGDTLLETAQLAEQPEPIFDSLEELTASAQLWEALTEGQPTMSEDMHSGHAAMEEEMEEAVV